MANTRHSDKVARRVPVSRSRDAVGTVLRRGVRWSVAVVVFVLTLEAAIRVDDAIRWGAPVLGPYSHAAMFGVDSIGWRPRVGAHFEKWRINQYGFSGPEMARLPAPGTVRVAVLGASETFGQSESPDHEFPRALERMLNEDIAPGLDGVGAFEVVNAGIPGMSLGRIREYWSDWVVRFQPEIVIVYPSPGFYLGNNPPADENPRSGGAAPTPRDRPRLPGKLRMVLNRFLPEAFQARLKEFMIARERAEHPDDWVWHEIPAGRLSLFERHLRELLTDLVASGATPVLATHARAVDSTEGNDWSTMIGWQRFQPRAELGVILDFERRVNQSMGKIGREMGVEVVRMDRAVPADPSYFSDHQHFTDAGAELVAAALSEAVHEVLSGSSGSPAFTGNR